MPLKSNNMHLKSSMRGSTKSILLLLLFSFLLFPLFYNVSILKLAKKKTNTMICGNRSHSNEIEPNNKRQQSSEGEEDMPNQIAKEKNYETESKASSKRSQVKVLLLAYGRTGSSLTGDLISADTTSAYFFEPFWWV